MKALNCNIIFFVLCVVSYSQVSQAGNCTTLLADLMTYAKGSTGGDNNKVQVFMTTNANTPDFATYTNIFLDYKPAFIFRLIPFPESLAGTANSLISNRKAVMFPNGPFDPLRPAKTTLSLTKNAADANFLNVSLVGWNTVTFKARCDNGHIYGFAPNQSRPSVIQLYDLAYFKN
ncbi:MAG: hypothetical protein ABL933_11570 [Methyloglobulus sp.]|nr:hypothetical protein [Methyloglobulus sp.]